MISRRQHPPDRLVELQRQNKQDAWFKTSMTLISVIPQSPIIVVRSVWQSQRSAAKRGGSPADEISPPEGASPEQERWWVGPLANHQRHQEHLGGDLPSARRKMDHPFVWKWSVWIPDSLLQIYRRIRQISRYTTSNKWREATAAVNRNDHLETDLTDSRALWE